VEIATREGFVTTRLTSSVRERLHRFLLALRRQQVTA